MTLKPITTSTKKAYDPKINYNSTKDKADAVADQKINIAYYNHDCRYSDPTLGGTHKPVFTRAQADKAFLNDMESAGASFIKRWAEYLAVRAGGWASWANCRANDKLDAAAA